MITRISSGSSPAGAVFYNEQKVEKGEAERLAVRNYEGIRLAPQHLTASMVADKLVDRASLNERIKLPTFHVSLALAKGEGLPASDLLSIADQYMQQMGYGRQPYAVYQHHDTEHPHVHIVSVRINEAGKKVSDKFEREKSNTIRQQIEKEFGLQVAEKVSLKPERHELKPVDYGKGDLKADLSAVVQGILKDFTFSSFTQYNQLLKIYNVQATEIQKEGQKTGLKYSAIDTGGNPVGAAIKASSLAHRPTREVVERRIGAGKKIKGDRISPIRKAADSQLSQSKTWDEYQQRLSRIGVEVIPHLGKDGNLFGISYIDTKQRIIYTGSELGKAFTAGSLKTALGETYQPPSVREIRAEKQRIERPSANESKPNENRQSTSQQPSDQAPAQERSSKPESEESPNTHVDLMRQLLYALNDDNGLNESEYDLKKMLKKSHKPRLS